MIKGINKELTNLIGDYVILDYMKKEEENEEEEEEENEEEE